MIKVTEVKAKYWNRYEGQGPDPSEQFKGGEREKKSRAGKSLNIAETEGEDQSRAGRYDLMGGREEPIKIQ